MDGSMFTGIVGLIVMFSHWAWNAYQVTQHSETLSNLHAKLDALRPSPVGQQVSGLVQQLEASQQAHTAASDRVDQLEEQMAKLKPPAKRRKGKR